MATHLAARLVWHDRGWDGRICTAPKSNGWCIRYEWVHEGREDDKEAQRSCEPIKDGFLPPCIHDANAFGKSTYTFQHKDPLYRSFLSPTSQTLHPYSFVTAPFRRMRDDEGWIYDPQDQKQLLEAFFGALEEKQSLVFFYGMHGNPIDDESDRVLFAVGRITSVDDLKYFGGKDENGHRYPIWWRKITHSGDLEGVRLPYQEYLALDDSGQAARRILCRIPAGARSEFSFVGEHVRDDTAIAVMERLGGSLAQVERDGIVKGPWKKARTWVQTTLAELWRERGAYPGIPAVLEHLGVANAQELYRVVFKPLERERKDAAELVFALLEGKKSLPRKDLQKQLTAAAVEWQDKRKVVRDLLRLLIRFDLTRDQAERVISATKRRAAGIVADEKAILDNPYLLVEQDLGEEDSGPIGFDSIDHGMMPDKDKLDIVAEAPIGRNDRRRIRALLVQVLKTASRDGDTFLPLQQALGRAAEELAENRQIDGDAERFLDEAEWHSSAVELLDVDGAPPLLALRTLREMENFVAKTLTDLVDTKYKPSNIDWSSHVKEALVDADALSDEAEARAREEKINVLERAIQSRLSVITGRAGTGKTTIVRALLKGIEEVEGKQSLLLLTPTGKARARLKSRTGRDAQTIHSLLKRNDWLHRGTFSLKWEGGKQAGARTVVIDEASMLPIDLLAVLLKALDQDQIRRLIFVGDPNQLPPIGPGRPLTDIVTWLGAPERSHALGNLRERARAKDVNSEALQLSDLFTAEPPNASDDDILVRAALGQLTGDLEVHFWTDTDELEKRLFARLEQFLEKKPAEKEYEGFNRSLRDEYGAPYPDRWQILSPLRGEGFGTEQLNRMIQHRFHGGLLRMRGSRPMGAQQLVVFDKVMQTRNQTRTDREKNDYYVANGDVGLVVNTSRKYKGLSVSFVGQDVELWYFGKKDVEENLELAYATTIHKAQGSDFEVVFLIIPKSARTLSRELLYTAITRFKSRLMLFIEGGDVTTLEKFSRPEFSATTERNTYLFDIAGRPDLEGVPYPERLIHRSKSGTWVRSKSELVVARALDDLNVSYKYEQRLPDPKNPKFGYLPDFTIFHKGEVYYWEHLGMLDQTTYRKRWERKLAWYKQNGLEGRLILSKDGTGGSLDEIEISNLARSRIR